MTPKQLVQEFYKSDAMLDSQIIEPLLHDDLVVNWHSSKGFIEMNKAQVLSLLGELSQAYIRSKIRITHLLEEENSVAVKFSHFVKTFENPREEMLLAHFMVIWEIKDAKLYRGFQMSQL
ncbi:nuclear transport factor 2 family protein [Flavobacterium sp. NST-5]|uniref:Nuclear transport factor 2 family protein n=1 Tax=Flavobacterium ichthyis TaxID=2698827 RepID=A0ABW9Z8Y0_9FLAO|nr:nuclear transport factor 2 family protein [Flavobacterium ichthyis]NBL65176.1 nuclear transport factor 2 family protein [Flavobacterium ichthyis]